VAVAYVFAMATQLVLVQIPPEALPYEHDDVMAVWDRLEGWVNETLGDACSNTGVDFSSEMTAMTDVEDPSAAVRALVEALPSSGLPSPVRIAVREGDDASERDVIKWPGEEAGGDLPA
jgi:hypothetical protein